MNILFEELAAPQRAGGVEAATHGRRAGVAGRTGCASRHNGAKWKDLPARFGSKSTVHRWFLTWVKAGVFESVMQAAGRCVKDTGGFRLYECFIDGTFSKAKSGGDGIGCTRVGKGVKIMILVDAKGLPVAACSAPANPAESHLIQQLFGFMISQATPERVASFSDITFPVLLLVLWTRHTDALKALNVAGAGLASGNLGWRNYGDFAQKAS